MSTTCVALCVQAQGDREFAHPVFAGDNIEIDYCILIRLSFTCHRESFLADVDNP